MYKNFTRFYRVPRGYTYKFLLVMKITTIILFVFIMQVSAASFGQRLTIRQSKLSLKQFFGAIEQQTGYDVLYESDKVDDQLTITAGFKEAPLLEALNQAFAGQALTFTIDDKTIIIKERTASLLEQARALFAQVTVSGRVVDETGQPLPGATVRIKGTQQGVTTDVKGNFTLTVADDQAILIFSFTGYDPVELAAREISSTIILKASNTNLKEVVVNKGYYTTTQLLNTGNVTKVSGDDIKKQPVSDPLHALEGRVPGLYIAQASGIPGSYSTVRLRGQNSIANGNIPLYIVNGVPYSSASTTNADVGGGAVGNPGNNANGLSPFNNLNPADIESIEVLKDADATAIYGSRGANGVILITTRKGKPGQTKVNLDISSAMGRVAHFLPLMNTQQYLEMRREALVNDGKLPGPADLDLNGTWDQQSYTDWQRLLIGNTSHYNNVQASVSGGSANTQFLFSGGNSRQTTVFPAEYGDQKTSFNVNLNHRSVDNKFQALFTGSYVKDISNLPLNDISGSINIAPNAPNNLIDANGNLLWSNPYGNPYSAFRRNVNNTTGNLIGNLNIGYEILPGLEAKISGGYTRIQSTQTATIPASTYSPPNNTNASLRTNQFGTNDVETWILEPQLNYTRTIGNGRLAVLVGSSYQQNKQSLFAMSGTNFTSDDQIANIQLAPTLTIRGNKASLYHYSAAYARINYDWEQKYLINFTARRDGSSRFGPGNRFGNFGAVGAGWIFSQEKLVQENLPFLSLGKLRGSYGTTGNDQFADYAYLGTFTPYTNSNYQDIIGLYSNKLTNPYFGWESVRKLEYALELGFVKDRIMLTISHYRNRTGNQLVGYALPTTTGFSSVIANLPAVIQNTGTEVELHTTNIKGNCFKWESSFNISVPRNKLVSYPGLASSSYATVYVEGRSLYIQRKYHVTGVNPQTGIYTIEDVNNDGTINANDFQFIKENTQNYFGGFDNRFTYKNFGLDVLFQFVKQNGLFFSGSVPGAFAGGSGNQLTDFLNRWKMPGDQAKYERFTQQAGPAITAFTNAVGNGDHQITDASFIRLKNVSLSYQLPVSWLKKWSIDQVRLFAQAQNLLTLTNYPGLDPESQGRSLPPLRMINFGIHVSL